MSFRFPTSYSTYTATNGRAANRFLDVNVQFVSFPCLRSPGKRSCIPVVKRSGRRNEHSDVHSVSFLQHRGLSMLLRVLGDQCEATSSGLPAAV